MTMGNRVSVIKKGELQQVGTPSELFDAPTNLFVAGFIGSPSMNFFSSKLEGSDGKVHVLLEDHKIAVEPSVIEERPALKNYTDKEVIVGIRPQDFEDAEFKSDAPEDQRISVNPDLVEAIGTETLVHFVVNAPIVMTDDMKELAEDTGAGEAERLEERAAEGHNEFVAQLDPKTKIQSGTDVELVVDTTRLHFFDTETSQGIYK
jgi:multiple sugar transport system ATP-binding protein